MSALAAVDGEQLERRIRDVSRAMAAHGGGIELVSVDARGKVRVRFVGLCAACQLRPLTFSATIEPALGAVDGVTEVQGDGARVSDEALERIRRYHGIRPIEYDESML